MAARSEESQVRQAKPGEVEDEVDIENHRSSRGCGSDESATRSRHAVLRFGCGPAAMGYE